MHIRCNKITARPQPPTHATLPPQKHRHVLAALCKADLTAADYDFWMKPLVKSGLAGLLFTANGSVSIQGGGGVASTAPPESVSVTLCMSRCNTWVILLSAPPRRTLQREYEQLKEQHGQRGGGGAGGTQQWESDQPDEADLLAEAKLLRQHKGRLEARMHILEEHNKQLESQLHRLRQLLHQVTHNQVSSLSVLCVGEPFRKIGGDQKVFSSHPVANPSGRDRV